MERIQFLLINDIYNQFWEVLQSQGTDDCEWSGWSHNDQPDKNALDKFEYDGNTNLVYSVWIKHYVAVNRSNFAIENISNMGNDQIKDDARKRLIGEAKFLRALAYFNLVRRIRRSSFSIETNYFVGWFGSSPEYS